MILVRTIFQAQWGKGGELAAIMKQATQSMAAGMASKPRVLTDLRVCKFITFHPGHVSYCIFKSATAET